MMDSPCEINVPKCDMPLSESYRIVICYQSSEVNVIEVRKQLTNRCIFNTLTGKLVYIYKPWSVSCGDTLLIISAFPYFSAVNTTHLHTWIYTLNGNPVPRLIWTVLLRTVWRSSWILFHTSCTTLKCIPLQTSWIKR